MVFPAQLSSENVSDSGESESCAAGDSGSLLLARNDAVSDSINIQVSGGSIPHSDQLAEP